MMQYIAVAESDKGMQEINQDRVLIRHTTYEGKEILMSVICDGLGGLSRSEIASETVIHEFEEWFSIELPYELKNVDMGVIASKWVLLLKALNVQIREYGKEYGERLGTTFTGALFIDDNFVLVHIGDTRMYYIGELIEQLTCDHTYTAREILKGNLTQEQAKTNKYRNVLLQCVGASKKIEPQIICGKVKQGVYMLCSDGFRHKVTENEIRDCFVFKDLNNRRKMAEKCRRLIDLNKQRKERDNISVILIKTYFNQKSKKAGAADAFRKIFRKTEVAD